MIPFHVPPLRERREDIPILARAFVEEFCAESGVRPKTITPRALTALQAYPWPGNVRELRNLIERLVLLTPGPEDPRPRTCPRRSAAACAPRSSRRRRLEDARRAFERDFLRERLREHGWNISRTAEAIGIARESLSRKMRQFGIRVPA